MKILHSADWHLGKILHEQSLLEEQKQFIPWFIQVCKKGNYDAVVIAGDIFDRSIPPEEAVQIWTAFLEDYTRACPQTPLVVIAGNHDNPIRLAYAAGVLKNSGVHIVGPWDAPQNLTLVDTAGLTAEIWPLPFLWPGALEKTALGESGPTTTQEETIREAILRIKEKQNSGALQVLVAHCFARGGEVSDSERTLVGLATQIPSEAFDGFDYVALGHLHRQQEVCPQIWYSGSPLAYSFSESTDLKVILEVTLAPGLSPLVKKIPVPIFRALHIIKAPLGEILTKPEYLIWKESYLRVETSDAQGIIQPFHRLRQIFPHILSFELLPLGDSVLGESVGNSRQTITQRPRDIREDFKEFMEDLNLSPEEVDKMNLAFVPLASRVKEEE